MQTNGTVGEVIRASGRKEIETNNMESPPSAPEQSGSQQIIEHMTATIDEVHTYALEKLTDLENKIVALKQSIVAQKNRSQQETQIYIETVDAALRTSEDLDRLVDELERGLPKEPKKTNGNGRLSMDN
jgi:hypothetical protein